MIAPNRAADSLRHSLPAAGALFLVLLCGLRLPFFHGLSVFPHLGLMAVFYWSLFRPALLPWWFLFLLGLLQDVLLGTPLGVWALAFCVAKLLVLTQQRLIATQHFVALWISFAFLAALIELLLWAGLGLYYRQLLPPTAHMVQWALTAALYPPFHFLFTRIYALLPRLQIRL